MEESFDLELIKSYALDIGLWAVLLVLIYLGLYLIDLLAKRTKQRLLDLKLKSVKIFSLEIINVGKQELIIASAINVIQILFSLTFLYLSLVVILSEIPATESIAVELVDLIFVPLQSFIDSVVAYLPSLFTIIVTIVIARYLIKAVKYIANGVVLGNFHFPGFEARTARTTGGIITFLLYILTIIIIFPNMPGYETDAFKGVATFLGVLITIGGSSVIANYMAGIVLTYMHAFEKGDWVEIDGIAGQIVETRAFGIRLNSYKREAINIPNSKVLGSAIHNYSGKNKKELILHTEVSIGYDVPWKKVNRLLIDAAKRTKLLGTDPEPFVYQKKLDDFYIVYELNARLQDPSLKPKAQSELHSNILDLFNENNIEIMSPHYRAERDGTPTTLSSDKLNQSDDQTN